MVESAPTRQSVVRLFFVVVCAKDFFLICLFSRAKTIYWRETHLLDPLAVVVVAAAAELKLEVMFCCHERVITSPRELLSKLPLLADAALVWTMHFHSFVPPAAAAAAPATRCCSQRGQLPDDP